MTPWTQPILPLPGAASVLALGSGLKNTVCAGTGGQAWVSSLCGDLTDAGSCVALESITQAGLKHLSSVGAAKPKIIAHDLHPDFFSTLVALACAERLGVPSLAVQHHHAHIAAVCGEHRWNDQPILGLALDGMGWGTDGTAWGGELLWLRGADCQRLSSLKSLHIPGLDVAAREPWRSAAAVLHALGRTQAIGQRFAHHPLALKLQTMLSTGWGCHATTSAGRWFDAAASLLGLCDVMSSEAEAPALLEQAATQHGGVQPLRNGWRLDDALRLDISPLMDHLADCDQVGYGAALFHATLIAGLSDWVALHGREHQVSTVALAGGCMHNRLLREGLAKALQERGIEVLVPMQLGPGDASISYGQAVVAAWSVSGA